jgi:hypothetical protein
VAPATDLTITLKGFYDCLIVLENLFQVFEGNPIVVCEFTLIKKYTRQFLSGLESPPRGGIFFFPLPSIFEENTVEIFAQLKSSTDHI